MDLALNNLQRLICHKPQTTNQSIPISTESNIIIHIGKLSISILINHKSTIRKYCLIDKIRPDFFRTVAASILLYTKLGL